MISVRMRRDWSQFQEYKYLGSVLDESATESCGLRKREIDTVECLRKRGLDITSKENGAG